ncbi:hypothetical protein QX776_07420 [Alteromonadaceae bacterium BrNp21-10]|nr:hypothetical protein [Alteromonadaceae bacterium BrNp21-10]
MSTTKLTIRVFTGVDTLLKNFLNQLFLKRDGFIEHLIKKELPHLAEALGDRCNSPSARAFINQSMDKERLAKKITIVIDKSIAEKLRKISMNHNLSRDAFVNRLLIIALLNQQQLKVLGVQQEASEIESVIGYSERTPSGPMSALSYWMDDPFFLIRESLKLAGENMYLVDLDCLKSGLNTKTACYLPDEQLPDPKFEELAKSITKDDFLPEDL